MPAETGTPTTAWNPLVASDGSHWATSSGTRLSGPIMAWLHPSCFFKDLDNGGPRINRVAQIRLAQRLVWTCGCVGSTMDNGQLARLQDQRLFRFTPHQEWPGHSLETVKQQAGKIILQGPRCRETRFPRNGQTQVSPTSSPRGMSVEQHITATSIHTITTTIVRTPQTVDGPRLKVETRWWSSLFVPCHGAVPSNTRCAALQTKSHPLCHCTFTASQTGA